uniref:Uncharacterized protein n=1 Tax=Arundo donax TaxID=35708 RepID=A0A0A9BZW5_ARUDO
MAKCFHNAKKYRSSHSEPSTKHRIGVHRIAAEIVCHKTLMGCFTISLYVSPVMAKASSSSSAPILCN